MKFQNKRFITSGVDLMVNPLLQLFLWHLVDSLPLPKDYLQIFKLTEENAQQKITHIQEKPEYTREYLINTDAPVFIGKIYAIDDETHSTMLLAEEY
jgi:hypothetical protein